MIGRLCGRRAQPPRDFDADGWPVSTGEERLLYRHHRDRAARQSVEELEPLCEPHKYRFSGCGDPSLYKGLSEPDRVFGWRREP